MGRPEGTAPTGQSGNPPGRGGAPSIAGAGGTGAAESDGWLVRIGAVTAAGLVAAALFAMVHPREGVFPGLAVLAAVAVACGGALHFLAEGRRQTVLALVAGIAIVLLACEITVGARVSLLVGAFPAFVVLASASLGPAAGFRTANGVVLAWGLLAGLAAGGLDPVQQGVANGPGRTIVELALVAVLLGGAALAAAWSRWDADPGIRQQLDALGAERWEIESQLESVESLASAGWLVANVAHEVSNPVQAMDHLVFVLLDQTPHGDGRRESLVLVKQAIDRIAEYLSQLSDFYRSPDGGSMADVNRTLSDVFRFLGQQLHNANVKVKLDLGPDLPAARISPERLRQAVLNVVLNAVEAMPRGGDLAVSTASNRDTLVVAIQDTGPGIPESARDRVFAPFYTTKSERGGTGLGLSISRRILRSHGGDLAVDGSCSVGARLILSLRPADRGT